MLIVNLVTKLHLNIIECTDLEPDFLIGSKTLGVLVVLGTSVRVHLLSRTGGTR